MRTVGSYVKWLAAMLGLVLAVVLALVASLWHWSRSDSSLATMLQHMQAYLPAGQTLEAKDVSGSVRAGGHIGMLRWTRGDFSVQADDVDIAWSIEPLLRRQLQLGQLTAQMLTIADKSPASQPKAMTPPTDLRLPFTVDVPFAFKTVRLTGTPAFEAQEVSGHYIFDSSSHRLEKGQGTISYGSYQFEGTLQAQAPMALKLQADGAIQTTLPSSQQALQAQAHASLTGELAKPDATLSLQARLQPELPVTKGSKHSAPSAMQAQVSAQIHPWQVQPLAQGQAQWAALDLAALWPQAPHTALAGKASVTPSGAQWRAEFQASNRLPGPWDQGRLPLSTVQAEVQYAQGQWMIESLDAQGAGGRFQGQGNWRDGQWQGDLSLKGLNPAALDSRLASASIQGKLKAAQSHAGIRFDTQLQSMPAALGLPVANPKTLALSRHLLDLGAMSLDAQGLWAAPQLSLTALRLEAPQALVQGALDFHTLTQAVQADLVLALPGLAGTLQGQLSRRDGHGKLALVLSDAGQARRWTERWPLPLAWRDALPIDGTASVHADWQGGWQQPGQPMKVNATLQAPLLTWSSPAGSAQTPTHTQLREAAADLTGTLAALQLRSSGTVNKGAQRVQWTTRLSGGQIQTGHWQGAVDEVKVSLQPNSSAEPWTILADSAQGRPINLDWQQDSRGHTVRIGQGSAQLHSPLPNDPHATHLNWQAISWAAPANAHPRWQSKGTLTGLPLVWVDLLDFKSLNELGIQSNMLINGDWDAVQGDSLSLRATLERSSGDLTLRTGDERQPTQSAGVSLAQLQLQLTGDQVSAKLRWDSQRAGQAQLTLTTRLVNRNGTRDWPADAPVSGKIQVQMPPIEAWSVLAPPGWRLRGTLDAQATLAGTRATPHWRGTLQAKDLAVRSVADGVDFQQGSLLARLEGQQLLIDAFDLRGAGKDGGQISVSGAAQWRDAAKANATPMDHVDMQLKAEVQTLRLSTRSDRRLTVSGSLLADLKDTRLQMRGKLRADRATITLPSESAPALGDDVVVRPSRTDARAGTHTPLAKVKHPGARILPEVQISFDLGSDFQVRGRGLETRLAGQLELLASEGYPPTLTGTVSTVRGSYQAYGQRLNIEQGLVRFVGPVDNPVLDILAIRPNLTQRVGVQVIGTVLFPVVRLYAEPDLPEAEKLAWLVMGHSANGSGQGPTRSLTQALGLDELSFRGASGNTDTTSGATVTLGKRLSNDFYVAYESGLAGTMGVFSIFYDLSRSLTLRAKTGDQSAVDVIWTRRYD